MFDPKNKSSVVFKSISCLQIITLLIFFTIPANLIHAQTVSVLNLPVPGTMVTASEKFVPPLVKGITLHPENPLAFDFIIDPGNAELSRAELKAESEKLIKYFLASLTIPEEDLWVNLSPYENNRIVPPKLSETEMGRDLLAQDYILKQLSASLIYPEKDLGRDFWNRVYQKAKAMYGTTDIPVNTFNKVWIVPQQATILETDDTAFIVKSRLKVMLETDYVSLDRNRANAVLGTNHLNDKELTQVNSISTAIVKEIILPEIEREVNEGKNFAPLRQIYNSLILAVWFKTNLKDNLINQIYSNQDKVNGIDLADKTVKDKIYQQYVAAYRKGVFNYIKEDSDEGGKVIPRKYFSGGFSGKDTGALVAGQRISAKADSGNTVDSLIKSGAIPAASVMPEVPTKPFEVITTVLGSRQNLSDQNRPDGASDRGVLSAKDPTPELKQALEAKVTPVRETVQELTSRFFDAKAAGPSRSDELKGIEKDLNTVIDRENTYRASDPKDLIMSDDIRTLNNFKSSVNFQPFRAQATKVLLDGNYVPQFIFAGAATRLGRGEMYPLDIWDIAKEKQKIGESDGVYKIGMGPRQIIAYRMALEREAGKAGLDRKEVLLRQKMIFNINENVAETVLRDMQENNFYGFNRENILFIIQPIFLGMKLEGGQMTVAPESNAIPSGHGYATMQLKEKGQAFRLTAAGQREILTEQSALDTLRDDMFIGTHRINDLTRLTSDSIMDIDKLAMQMYELSRGNNVVAELVANPGKQKGGTALKNTQTGQSFLLETSNAKGSPELTALLNEAGEKGAPYNAFRLLYQVMTFKDLSKGNLPNNLRVKDGYIYAEAVTGDITQKSDAKAVFFTTGEEIHDFKEEKNIEDAVGFLRQQDQEIQKNPEIKALVERAQTVQAERRGQEMREVGRDNYGGIDLNPANLKIEINKESGGVNVQYDPALIEQLRQKGVDGFTPFIINMQSIPSVIPLLSESHSEQTPVSNI